MKDVPDDDSTVRGSRCDLIACAVRVPHSSSSSQSESLLVSVLVPSVVEGKCKSEA